MGRTSKHSNGFSHHRGSTSEKSDSVCDRRICLWLLYTLVSLSFGMIVLTFWVGLYRYQEQRLEIIGLRRAYNESFKHLNASIMQKMKLEDEDKHIAFKSGIPNRMNRILQNKIQEMKKEHSEAISGLTSRLNSWEIEREELFNIIKLKLNETDEPQNVKSLKSEVEKLQSVYGWIDSFRTEWGKQATAIDSLRRQIIELESDERSLLSSAMNRLEKIAYRVDLFEKKIVNSFENNSKTIEDIVEWKNNEESDIESYSNLLKTYVDESFQKYIKQINLTESKFFLKIEDQEKLANSEIKLLDSKVLKFEEIMDKVSKKVDHFIINLLKLKSLPRDVLALESRLDILNSNLENVMTSVRTLKSKE